MFFFLSKTLGYLVRPMVILCLAFVAAWLTRRNKRRMKFFLTTGFVLLFLFSNEFLTNEIMNAWEIKATPFASLDRTYSYGILLTGAGKVEVGPPDRVYIGSAADRINHTLQLYKTGKIRKILVSGGSGRLVDIGTREADDLAGLLQLMGVPSEDLLIENESRNTHESAVRVATMLRPLARPVDCLLITSASHMRRSLATFNRAGWPCTPFAVDFHGHFRKYDFDVLFIPKVEAVVWWQTLLKEWTGYFTYWVAGYI
jgi:uncharacterized SAM-binding protein YcdF (DUF218 family)